MPLQVSSADALARVVEAQRAAFTCERQPARAHRQLHPSCSVVFHPHGRSFYALSGLQQRISRTYR